MRPVLSSSFQTNTEKLRSLESRDATKSLVETLLSGINQQQHAGSSKAAPPAACDTECVNDEEESVCSVRLYHGGRGGGSGSRHRAEYYYCDGEDEPEEDEEVSESHDLTHQLEMEAELARARKEALRLQQQNRALLGELEDLDKLLVEAGMCFPWRAILDFLCYHVSMCL